VTADQVIHRFTLDSYAGLRRSWTLRSPQAWVYDEEHRVEIEAPRIQFYDAGRPGSKLTAGRGRIDSESRDVWASRGVVIISSDGARLESDHMHYVASQDRILSTAPVVVRRGSSEARGIGWEATPNLSEVVIREQRSDISPDDARALKRR
jgi:LPS export ABC transporter protein LptC